MLQRISSDSLTTRHPVFLEPSTPFMSEYSAFVYERHIKMYRIGCFCGAMSVFFLGAKLGRKKCIYVGAFLQFIGAVLQASAFGVPQMIVGRIIWFVGGPVYLTSIDFAC